MKTEAEQYDTYMKDECRHLKSTFFSFVLCPGRPPKIPHLWPLENPPPKEVQNVVF